MKTMKLTASKPPNKKERAEYLKFMRTEQIGKLIVTIRKQDAEGNPLPEEEMVLELEHKDAEGRSFLVD